MLSTIIALAPLLLTIATALYKGAQVLGWL
jgi:hypothetical protein